MDLATLEPAITALAQLLCGADAVVSWADAPAMRPNGTEVLINAPAIRGLGMDDVRREFDAGATDPLVESVPIIEGQRVITVSLQVTTFDQTAGFTARSVLETARTMCLAPSVEALLEAANMSLVSFGDVVYAPYKLQGRMWSRYVLDLRLGATARLVDTAGATSTIERVGITAQLQNPDGTSRPDVAFDVPE
jgi:hypothetical protein